MGNKGYYVIKKYTRLAKSLLNELGPRPMCHGLSKTNDCRSLAASSVKNIVTIKADSLLEPMICTY